MQRFLSFTTLLLICIGFFPVNTYSSETGHFIVTAYYSPLPDQEYYIMGSYEAEVRMNGRGTNGASGREVFSGMLAAPSKYGFGTKIYLEGLGIGDVQDRGGAIVPAGQRGYSHDRIDVWVGKGEEGLRRAMYWGKRKVKGQIVSGSKASTLNYNTIPAPLWAANNLKRAPQVPGFFHRALGVGSDVDGVKSLQKFLGDIGKYHGEIDGVYNSEVIDIVFDFQVENKLISYDYEYGAGYWGTKTRKLFLKKYLSGEYQNPVEQSDPYETVFDGPANSPEKVEILQDILTKLGLYEGEIDGDYSSITGAIFEFQVIHELIDSNNHPAAGWFGPKTRETLAQTYKDYLEQQEILARQEAERQILKDTATREAEGIIESIGLVIFGEISPEVRELQMVLKDLGYFNHKDTAIFGKVTSNSILKFQIDSDLVQSASDIGAGNYGPKTRGALLRSLTEFIYQQKLVELEGEDEDVAIGEIGYYTA